MIDGTGQVVLRRAELDADAVYDLEQTLKRLLPLQSAFAVPRNASGD